ncbi:Uncharacterised protein [Klebsiella pneumoniae]|nr:Uncharacterised protein [Klebsiella pneumoniae]
MIFRLSPRSVFTHAIDRRRGHQAAHRLHHFGCRAGTDDKLVLAPLLDVAFYALQLAQIVELQLPFIADLNAHPRHAVFQFNDIGRAANALQQRLRQSGRLFHALSFQCRTQEAMML